MFAEEASQDFEDFLDVLGERVRLKGWDRFRGGLDVKGKIYTKTYIHRNTYLWKKRKNKTKLKEKLTSNEKEMEMKIIFILVLFSFY